MTTLAAVADAVTAVIAGASIAGPGQVRVERQWLPLHTLAELQDLVITVVPTHLKRETAGRSRLRRVFQLDVGVQQKLATATVAEIDALVALSDGVAGLFDLNPLPGVSGVHWLSTEHHPLVAAEHLNEMRQFTSVLTLTFTEWV